MFKNLLKKLFALLIVLSIQIFSISSFVAAPSHNPSVKNTKTDDALSRCLAGKDTKEELAVKLATLGKKSQAIPLMQVRKSVFKGVPIEYVSTATGEMSFALNDISFAGKAPLFFQRVYSSYNTEDTGLGKGWNFVFNEKIVVDFNKATLINSSGERYEFFGKGFDFKKGGNTQKFVLETDEPASTQSFIVLNQSVIVERNATMEKIYEKYGESFYPTRIKVSNEGEIILQRFKDGRLKKISNKIGAINLHWSEEERPRLLALSDSAGRSVKFEQKAGELSSVKSVLGGSWKYNYTDGKLNKVTDPMKRILLETTYNEKGRAIQSGDAIRQNTFRYETGEHDSGLRTIITDSMSYALMVEHNNNGTIKQALDEKGFFADFKFDEANRLNSVTDESGQMASFNYDAEGKVLRQFNRVQGETTYQYNKNGSLISSVENGRQTKIDYDEKAMPALKTIKAGDVTVNTKYINGKVQEIEASNGGKVAIERNDKGQETALLYSDSGKIEFGYDKAGRKISERIASGKSDIFGYNLNNQLVRQSDNKGKNIQADYDQSGLLTKIGNVEIWVKNTRDSAGRIIKIESSTGKTRSYRYDDRGALIEYTNAKGDKTNFDYDEQGKLRRINNQESVVFKKPEAPYSGKFSFVKSNYEAEPVQYDGMNPCEIFARDGFLNGYENLDYVNGQTIDLSTNSILCDPFAGSGDSGGGFGGVGGGFGGWGGWGDSQETCEQCKAEEKKICDDALNNEMWAVIGGNGFYLYYYLYAAVSNSHTFSCLRSRIGNCPINKRRMDDNKATHSMSRRYFTQMSTMSLKTRKREGELSPSRSSKS